MVSIRGIWMHCRVAAQHAGASWRAQAPVGSWLPHLQSQTPGCYSLQLVVLVMEISRGLAQ